MGCFWSNVKMAFKGSNSPVAGLSWCQGIMTLKKHFLNFTEDKP